MASREFDAGEGTLRIYELIRPWADWPQIGLAQIQLVRHDTTRTTCRACRVVLVPTWPDDEEAIVLACTSLVFCALDLNQS